MASTFGRVFAGYSADSFLGPMNSIVISLFLCGVSGLCIWPFVDSLGLLIFFAIVNGVGGFVAGVGLWLFLGECVRINPQHCILVLTLNRALRLQPDYTPCPALGLTSRHIGQLRTTLGQRLLSACFSCSLFDS